MPRPNFEWEPFSKSRGPIYIIGTAHEEVLKIGSQSVQTIKYSKTFLSPKGFHARY